MSQSYNFEFTATAPQAAAGEVLRDVPLQGSKGNLPSVAIAVEFCAASEAEHDKFGKHFMCGLERQIEILVEGIWRLAQTSVTLRCQQYKVEEGKGFLEISLFATDTGNRITTSDSHKLLRAELGPGGLIHFPFKQGSRNFLVEDLRELENPKEYYCCLQDGESYRQLIKLGCGETDEDLILAYGMTTLSLDASSPVSNLSTINSTCLPILKWFSGGDHETTKVQLRPRGMNLKQCNAI